VTPKGATAYHAFLITFKSAVMNYRGGAAAMKIERSARVQG